MKKFILITCLVALPLTSFAEGRKFGIGAKVGTLGAGLDLSYNINSKLTARVNLNQAKANYDEIDDGVHYKGDLKLASSGILLDYHPFSNGFRLSGGVYNNGNKLETSSSSTGDEQIGDITYSLTNATLKSDVSFSSTAPYAGIGWGSNKKGLNFNIDAGILFQGSAKAKLTPSGVIEVAGGGGGNLINDAAFLAELAKEEENLNSDLSNFKQYPVITLGISYNFK